MWGSDIFLPCLIDCHLGFLSLAAEPNLNKTSGFYCTKKKNLRYSMRAAMPCVTQSWLTFSVSSCIPLSSVHFNPTLLFSHALFLLGGMLFTWITPAHHWGLSLCAPYSERHSLTKLLLCSSFLAPGFPMWKYIFYCMVNCLMSVLTTRY